MRGSPKKFHFAVQLFDSSEQPDEPQILNLVSAIYQSFTSHLPASHTRYHDRMCTELTLPTTSWGRKGKMARGSQLFEVFDNLCPKPCGGNVAHGFSHIHSRQFGWKSCSEAVLTGGNWGQVVLRCRRCTGDQIFAIAPGRNLAAFPRTRCFRR